jgi:hypothetical protein
MKSYLFDVKLFASIRIKAESEEAARRELGAVLDCAEVNFGADSNGNPVTGEASRDDDEENNAELIEETEE